ncbi:hypothetical protein KL936_003533 [Ogataea polymorpha]|nr:hypothetical protein KL936_003533 [Ogataea polymorpha]
MSQWPALAALMRSIVAAGHLEDGKKGERWYNCERIGQMASSVRLDSLRESLRVVAVALSSAVTRLQSHDTTVRLLRRRYDMDVIDKFSQCLAQIFDGMSFT